MLRIAIAGGGPGGLLAAYLLQQKVPGECAVTLFEAGDRVGGKILTGRFQACPAPFEEGVAELYDYSKIGPDPLRQLVEELGLKTVPMRGKAVVLDGRVLRKRSDIRLAHGEATLRAIDAFYARARGWIEPEDYYECHWQHDNAHPLARKTFAAVLEGVPDAVARRYIAVAVHSDLATEPHQTTGLYGVQNVLIDDRDYARLYAIEGGIEQLPGAIAARLEARIELERPVVRVEAIDGGRYRVWTRPRGQGPVAEEFNLVILALPNYWLPAIDWHDSRLDAAMRRHCARYDRPGHYLRISALFRAPFWRSTIPGSYFQLDAFGGCCVYDESARWGEETTEQAGGHAVLSWLLAGGPALTHANLDDDALVSRALDSLPGPLADEARDRFVEGRVKRWLGTVNALPGGKRAGDPTLRHQPDGRRNPNLLVVGDYLFDSTINGVLDSAHCATDLIQTLVLKRRYAPDAIANGSRPAIADGTNGRASHAGPVAGNGRRHAGPDGLEADYHDRYDGHRTYEESFEEYFDARYTADLIRIIWGAEPPYRLLDSGSASGLTLAAFDAIGIEAWGVENSPHIHARTAAEWRHRNILGDVRALKFADDAFDFTYDTCLCYLPEEDLDRAIRELHRVTRVGVFFGGITTDMTREVIEEHDLFYGVKSLHTTWEWSERFLRNGFRIAVTSPRVLAAAWECETVANEGGPPWYRSPESLRYCFLTKVPARVGARLAAAALDPEARQG